MVFTQTASDFTRREPFRSVGLVCPCGRAVAGFEGALKCACGAVYIVSVVVINEHA